MERLAQRDGVDKVEALTLSVGAISGVNRDSLLFCFESAAKGSILEGVKLLINEIKMQIHCRDCGKDLFPELFHMQCPECESLNVNLISGREFKLVSMEVK